MSNAGERKTTSHWAASEENCDKMEQKYGWKLLDKRRNDEQSILPVECIFEGNAEFPKSSMDYSAGDEDD
jgi:hypothetical protein